VAGWLLERRWVKNYGADIGKPVVEEDVSGGKPVEQRGLKQLGQDPAG
jgi:hypothetical protein